MRQEIAVCGYPRSGNTWLLRLMSDLLGARIRNLSDDDEDRRWCRDCAGSWVMVKTHRRLDRLLDKPRIVGIVRDPRDVMVSLTYVHGLRWPAGGFQTIRFMQEPQQLEPPDPASACSYLDFVEAIFESNIPKVRYEDLHLDGPAALARAAMFATAMPFSIEQCAETFDRITFERCHSADPHFARKGVVGDWRTHFNREHGQLFADIFNPHLLTRGYENDPGWWRELPA